ncbi:hypothetical protein M3Y98_01190600 [Aphelenchoides besseyi]|nr:hypothetical protein M3Y98_01190600 [Aphelenchoides besseyi]KAI6195046.1 hypothetical protein M3Y96_01189500 [Aphelenchoides besseyi]
MNIQTIVFLTSLFITAQCDISSISASECPSFCPAFCKGKCPDVVAKCGGNKCHCACSMSAVGCDANECEKQCKKDAGDRRYESKCIKPHVCKCSFSDITEDMIPFNYPIPKDAHYDIVVKPE